MKIPQFWLALTNWRAVVVQTREQLEAALARAPRRIVVEGTEALRAYAATMAYRGGTEAAAMERAPPPANTVDGYLLVPTIGRIRDGYRQRRVVPSRSRRRWLRVLPGLGPLLMAGVGLSAALLVEWLSFAGSTELVRRVHIKPPPPRRGVHVPLPTHAPGAADEPRGAGRPSRYWRRWHCWRWPTSSGRRSGRRARYACRGGWPTACRAGW